MDKIWPWNQNFRLPGIFVKFACGLAYSSKNTRRAPYCAWIMHGSWKKKSFVLAFNALEYLARKSDLTKIYQFCGIRIQWTALSMCSEGESRVASLIAAYQVGVPSCLATKHNKLNSNSRTHSHSAECSILARQFSARWVPDKTIYRNRRIEIETTDNPVHNNCVCTAQTSKPVVDVCSMLKW